MSFFSFKTKHDIKIYGHNMQNLDFYRVVEEFSNSIIEMYIYRHDFLFSLPFLKKLHIQNSYEADICTCPEIKEVQCSNLDKLDIGSLRPLTMGHVEMLTIKGPISLFNNLQVNRLINLK